MHAMIVDDSRLNRPIGFALLPKGSRASYRQAINAMKDMSPSTVIVETVVVDRSLAQLNALRASYPEAK